MEQGHALPDQRHPLAHVQEANSVPAAAVIIVQRKAHALSPALAARKPNSMVKLLVIRINVMTHDVRDAVERARPVGRAIAQKAIGHQTRGKSRGIGDDEQPHRHLSWQERKMQAALHQGRCALPSLDRLDSQMPPVSVSRYKLDPQQQQQVNPKAAHKMPVMRRRVERALAQSRTGSDGANHSVRAS